MVDQQACSTKRTLPLKSIFTAKTIVSVALLSCYNFSLLHSRVLLCGAFSTGRHDNAYFLQKKLPPLTGSLLSSSFPCSAFSFLEISGDRSRSKLFKENSSRSVSVHPDGHLKHTNDRLSVRSSKTNGDADKERRLSSLKIPQKSTQDSIEFLERDTTRVLKQIKNGTDDTIFPPIFGEARLSITRVWDLSMWTEHTSRIRYLRHIKGVFSSRLSRRIFPQVLACVLWSLVSIDVLAPRWLIASTHFVPFTSLSMVSTFVGFCLTLRSNQGLARLSEGRQLWGRAFIVARDTAQLLAAYAYPKDKELGVSAARHLSIFPWLLKCQLRGTDETDLIQTMIPSYTARSYLTSQRKPHVAIIAHLRQIVAHLALNHDLPLPAHEQLENNLNELNYIVGMCERIAGSPVPPVYTSHTSRLLVFYLACMPLALHGMAMKKAVTVLVTGVVGYTMLGLDEISHVLEQPFRLMPLQQVSRNIMLDVVDAFLCQPPGVEEAKEKEKEGVATEYACGGKNSMPEYW